MSDHVLLYGLYLLLCDAAPFGWTVHRIPRRWRDDHPLRNVCDRKLDDSAVWLNGRRAVDAYELHNRARSPSCPYRPPVR